MVKKYLSPSKIAVLILNVIIVFCTTSASSWEGGATKASQGAFPNGFYVMTNSYQTNSKVTIVNLDTGKTIDAYVIQNNSNTPAETVLISPEAAEGLGIRNNDIGRVKIMPPGELSIVRTQTAPAIYSGGDPDFDPKAAISLYGLSSIAESQPGPVSVPRQGPPPYSIIPDRPTPVVTQDYSEVQAPNFIIPAPISSEPAVIFMPAPAPVEAASEPVRYGPVLGYYERPAPQPNYPPARDYNEVQAPNFIIPAPNPSEPAVIIMPAPAPIEAASEMVPYGPVLGYYERPAPQPNYLPARDYNEVQAPNAVIASPNPSEPAVIIMPAPTPFESASEMYGPYYERPAPQPDYLAARDYYSEAQYPNAIMPAPAPSEPAVIVMPAPTPFETASETYGPYYERPAPQPDYLAARDYSEVQYPNAIMPAPVPSEPAVIVMPAPTPFETASETYGPYYERPAPQPDYPNTNYYERPAAPFDYPDVASAYPSLPDRSSSLAAPSPAASMYAADPARQSIIDRYEVPAGQPDYPTASMAIAPELPDISTYPSLPDRFNAIVTPLPEVQARSTEFAAQPQTPVIVTTAQPEYPAYSTELAVQPQAPAAATTIAPELPDVSSAYPSWNERFSSVATTLPEVSAYQADIIAAVPVDRYGMPATQPDYPAAAITATPDYPNVSNSYPSLPDRFSSITTPLPEASAYAVDPARQQPVTDIYEVLTVPPEYPAATITMAPELPDVSPVYPSWNDRFSSMTTPLPEVPSYSADPTGQQPIIDRYEVPATQPQYPAATTAIAPESPDVSSAYPSVPERFSSATTPLPQMTAYGTDPAARSVIDMYEFQDKPIQSATQPLDVLDVVDLFHTPDGFLTAILPTPSFLDKETVPGNVSGGGGPDISSLYSTPTERSVSPGMPSPQAMPYNVDPAGQPVIDRYGVPAGQPDYPAASIAIAPELPDISTGYYPQPERFSSIDTPLPQASGYAVDPALQSVIDMYADTAAPPEYAPAPTAIAAEHPDVSTGYYPQPERFDSIATPLPQASGYAVDPVLQSVIDRYVDTAAPPEYAPAPTAIAAEHPDVSTGYYPQPERFDSIATPLPQASGYAVDPALQSVIDMYADTATPSEYSPATIAIAPELPDISTGYYPQPERLSSIDTPLPQASGYAVDPALQSVIDMYADTAIPSEYPATTAAIAAEHPDISTGYYPPERLSSIDTPLPQAMPYNVDPAGQPVIDRYGVPAGQPDYPAASIATAPELPDISSAYYPDTERFSAIDAPLPQAMPYNVDPALQSVIDMYADTAAPSEYAPAATGIAAEHPDVSTGYYPQPERLSSIDTPLPQVSGYAVDPALQSVIDMYADTAIPSEYSPATTAAIAAEHPDVSSAYYPQPEAFSAIDAPLPQVMPYNVDPALQSVIDMYADTAIPSEYSPATTAAIAAEHPDVSTGYFPLAERLGAIAPPLPEATAYNGELGGQGLADLPDASPLYSALADRPVLPGMPSPQAVPYNVDPSGQPVTDRYETAGQPDYPAGTIAIAPEFPEISSAYYPEPERLDSIEAPLPQTSAYAVDPALQSVIDMYEAPAAPSEYAPTTAIAAEHPDVSSAYYPEPERLSAIDAPSPQAAAYPGEGAAGTPLYPATAAIGSELPDISSAYYPQSEYLDSIATPLPQASAYAVDPALQSVIDMYESPAVPSEYAPATAIAAEHPDVSSAYYPEPEALSAIDAPSPQAAAYTAEGAGRTPLYPAATTGIMPELPDVSLAYSPQPEYFDSIATPLPQASAYAVDPALQSVLDMYEASAAPSEYAPATAIAAEHPDVSLAYYPQSEYLDSIATPLPQASAYTAEGVAGTEYPAAAAIASEVPDVSPAHYPLDDRLGALAPPLPQAVPYNVDPALQSVIDMYEAPAIPSEYAPATAVAAEHPDVSSAYYPEPEALSAIDAPSPQAAAYTAEGIAGTPLYPAATTGIMPELPDVSLAYSPQPEYFDSMATPLPQAVPYNVDPAVQSVIDMYEAPAAPSEYAPATAIAAEQPDVSSAYYPQSDYLDSIATPLPQASAYAAEGVAGTEYPATAAIASEVPDISSAYYPQSEYLDSIATPLPQASAYAVDPALQSVIDMYAMQDQSEDRLPEVADAFYTQDPSLRAGLHAPSFVGEETSPITQENLAPDVSSAYYPQSEYLDSIATPLPQAVPYNVDPAVQSVIDMYEAPAIPSEYAPVTEIAAERPDVSSAYYPEPEALSAIDAPSPQASAYMAEGAGGTEYPAATTGIMPELPDVSPAHYPLDDRLGALAPPLPQAESYNVDPAIQSVIDMYEVPALSSEYAPTTEIAAEHPDVSSAYYPEHEALRSIDAPSPQASAYTAEGVAGTEYPATAAIASEVPDISSAYYPQPEYLDSIATPLPQASAYAVDPALQSVIDMYAMQDQTEDRAPEVVDTFYTQDPSLRAGFDAPYFVDDGTKNTDTPSLVNAPSYPDDIRFNAADLMNPEFFGDGGPDASPLYAALTERPFAPGMPSPQAVPYNVDPAVQSVIDMYETTDDVPDVSSYYPQQERLSSLDTPSPRATAYDADPAALDDPDVWSAYPLLPERLGPIDAPSPQALPYNVDPAVQSVIDMYEVPPATEEQPDVSLDYPLFSERLGTLDTPSPQATAYPAEAGEVPDVSSYYPQPERLGALDTPSPQATAYPAEAGESPDVSSYYPQPERLGSLDAPSPQATAYRTETGEAPDVSSVHYPLDERLGVITPPLPQAATYDADPAVQSVIDMYEVQDQLETPVDSPEVVEVFSTQDPSLGARLHAPYFVNEEAPKDTDAPSVVSAPSYLDDIRRLNEADLMNPEFFENVPNGTEKLEPPYHSTLALDDMDAPAFSWNEDAGLDASSLYPALAEHSVLPGMPLPHAVPYDADPAVQSVIDMYEVQDQLETPVPPITKPLDPPEVVEVFSTQDPSLGARLHAPYFVNEEAPKDTDVPSVVSAPSYLDDVRRLNEADLMNPEFFENIPNGTEKLEPPYHSTLALDDMDDPAFSWNGDLDISSLYPALAEHSVLPGMPLPQVDVYSVDPAVQSVIDMYEVTDDVPDVSPYYPQHERLSAIDTPSPQATAYDTDPIATDDPDVWSAYPPLPEHLSAIDTPWPQATAYDTDPIATDDPDVWSAYPPLPEHLSAIDTPWPQARVYDTDPTATDDPDVWSEYPLLPEHLSAIDTPSPQARVYDTDPIATDDPDASPLYSALAERPVMPGMPLPQAVPYDADPAVQSDIDMYEIQGYPMVIAFEDDVPEVSSIYPDPFSREYLSPGIPGMSFDNIEETQRVNPPYSRNPALENSQMPADYIDTPYIADGAGYPGDMRRLNAADLMSPEFFENIPSGTEKLEPPYQTTLASDSIDTPAFIWNEEAGPDVWPVYSAQTDPFSARMPAPEALSYDAEGTEFPELSLVYPDPLNREYSVGNNVYPLTGRFDAPETVDGLYPQDSFLRDGLHAPYFVDEKAPNVPLVPSDNIDAEDTRFPEAPVTGQYDMLTYPFPETTGSSEERSIYDPPFPELTYTPFSNNEPIAAFEPDYHFNGPETTTPYIAEMASRGMSTYTEPPYYNADASESTPQQPRSAGSFALYEPDFSPIPQEEIIVDTSDTMFPPQSAQTMMPYDPLFYSSSASTSELFPYALSPDTINTTEPSFYNQPADLSETTTAPTNSSGSAPLEPSFYNQPANLSETPTAPTNSSGSAPLEPSFYNQPADLSETTTAPASSSGSASLEPSFYTYNPNTSDMVYPPTREVTSYDDAYYTHQTPATSDAMKPQQSSNQITTSDPAFRIPVAPLETPIIPEREPAQVEVKTKVIIESENPVSQVTTTIIPEREPALLPVETRVIPEREPAPVPILETRVILERDAVPAAPELKTAVIPEPEKRYFSDTLPRIQNLEKGKYYLQLGIYQKKDAELDRRISDIKTQHYPLVIQAGFNDSTGLKLMVGPMNEGESNAVLLRFKRNGYKNAFIQHSGG